jgi:23S rRNA (adenine2503-C2)-methyltransferase
MKNVFDFDPTSFRAFALEHDLPSFTGDQVLKWVYEQGETDPQNMSNLSKGARECLLAHVAFGEAVPLADRLASDGTRKLLLGWPELAMNPALKLMEEEPSRQTECVLIPSDDRRTACLSSQVGCPVGCKFCASGLEGLEGNLTCGRIVEQAWRLGQLEGVGRISNIVFMGMGEPLANYAAVTDAIRTLNAPWGMGIGARKITLSTVGLPAAIRRFATFDLPVTLALSLHAPNDALRREIIPWAEYAPIDELLDACDAYFRQSGREITLEYILLRNVNDRPSHAEELATVARRLRSNVNLIRYNEVDGLPFERPDNADVHRFQEILRSRRVNSHIRASRGRDIEAACGQLRHERKTAGG